MSKTKARPTGPHKPEPQRKVSPKAAVVIAAALLAVLLFVILRLAFGGGGVQSVLQDYFENLYAHADVDSMALCFPEGALRDEFELLFTMGGVSNMAETYRMQAVEWVGEKPAVKVSVVEQEKPSSGALNEARAENSAVESVSDVTFDIRLTGELGSRTLRGSTRLTKIGGQWYLTDYNIRTGFLDGESTGEEE